MTNTKYLDEVANCMNYDRYHLDQSPQLFTVNDHRSVIPIIWAALKDGLYSEPPILLRFDGHADMKEIYFKQLKKSGSEAFDSLDKCLTFSNALDYQDGDWVKAAMELGLVSDVVTFYLYEDQIGSKVNPLTYKDKRNRKHKIFNFGRFSNQISFQGDLSDTARRKTLNTLWKTLGWDPIHGWPSNDNEWRQIWFDIDLDFAIHNLGNDFGKMPWREKDFNEEFVRSPMIGDYSFGRYRGEGCVTRMLTEAIRHSELMTISLEPKFSCGYKGVVDILENLNRVFQRYGDWEDGWNGFGKLIP